MSYNPERPPFTDSIEASVYLMREGSIENMVITREGNITEVRDGTTYVQKVSNGQVRCTRQMGKSITDDTFSMAIHELRPFSEAMKKEKYYIEFNVRSPFFAPLD